MRSASIEFEYLVHRLHDYFSRVEAHDARRCYIVRVSDGKGCLSKRLIKEVSYDFNIDDTEELCEEIREEYYDNRKSTHTQR